MLRKEDWPARQRKWRAGVEIMDDSGATDQLCGLKADGFRRTQGLLVIPRQPFESRHDTTRT